MKVLSLKKTVIILLFTLIFIISMSVIITLKISKTKIDNNNRNDVDLENIDIEIAEPDERICNDTKNKESNDEFLIEQYKNKKLVALTFDDGPSEYTSILVDELKKRNIPTTFFVLGSEIEKYPDTLKFEYDVGNEIGIHSYKHTLFTKLSDDILIILSILNLIPFIASLELLIDNIISSIFSVLNFIFSPHLGHIHSLSSFLYTNIFIIFLSLSNEYAS